jgi:hypothetical protein
VLIALRNISNIYGVGDFADADSVPCAWDQTLRFLLLCFLGFIDFPNDIRNRSNSVNDGAGSGHRELRLFRKEARLATSSYEDGLFLNLDLGLTSRSK